MNLTYSCDFTRSRVVFFLINKLFNNESYFPENKTCEVP